MEDLKKVRAVVGTNSWGRASYQRAFRGRAVDEDTLRAAARRALELDLPVFDTAQSYGLGEGQRLIGSLCPPQALISAKFTPASGKYESGQVPRALMRDLQDLGRDRVEVYWLHLPNSLEENLREMAALYREGRIGQIGISNVNLSECRRAKAVLEDEGVPLYGVQNHYSLLSRDWEREGVVGWCRENGIAFWAWAVLEEGILVPPRREESRSLLHLLFAARRRRLYPLYRQMQRVGKRHGLTIAQVAISYVANKGIVPVCGCRRPEEIRQLREAVDVTLKPRELRLLEETAGRLRVRGLGADLFRFMVRRG